MTLLDFPIVQREREVRGDRSMHKRHKRKLLRFNLILIKIQLTHYECIKLIRSTAHCMHVNNTTKATNNAQFFLLSFCH